MSEGLPPVMVGHCSCRSGVADCFGCCAEESAEEDLFVGPAVLSDGLAGFGGEFDRFECADERLVVGFGEDDNDGDVRGHGVSR